MARVLKTGPRYKVVPDKRLMTGDRYCVLDRQRMLYVIMGATKEQADAKAAELNT